MLDESTVLAVHHGQDAVAAGDGHRLQVVRRAATEVPRDGEDLDAGVPEPGEFRDLPHDIRARVEQDRVQYVVDDADPCRVGRHPVDARQGQLPGFGEDHVPDGRDAAGGGGL